MPKKNDLQQVQSAVQGLGNERVLIRLEESDAGVALQVFDTQDGDERPIVLDGLPFVEPDWPGAERLLALMLGLRRTRDKIKSSIRVERLAAEQRSASGGD